ncbi:stage II sporulation protein D [Gorillibacterium sp. sgz500922]|uniref:stage II sporulation protein D n=1 Tax=Gorillibacterium sp. sgz500922 TaxID=3446694 RepID=UPI003F67267B
MKPVFPRPAGDSKTRPAGRPASLRQLVSAALRLPALLRGLRLRRFRLPRLAVFVRFAAAPAPASGTAVWRVRRTPPLPAVCLGLALFAALGVMAAGLLSHRGGEAQPQETVRPGAAATGLPLPAATAGQPGGAAVQVPAASAAPLAGKLSLVVPVYLARTETVQRLPLEDYVLGVVAAEMPADFAPEALKAQALAARTYIVRRYLDGDFSGVPDKTAWVTDTVQHQAFLTDAQLRKSWGAEYAANRAKLARAVEETAGVILTYGGKPINAVFFSSGNGYTENAEDYWNVSEPYLRSVPSPWDKDAPGYETTVTISKKQLVRKLGLSGKLSANAAASGMRITARTEGHRVAEVQIGDASFSGREIREKLGLRSSSFEWKVKGSQIEFTTFGNGHGVGMSQWGAEGMAREGKSAEDIVRYYYRGVRLQNAGLLLGDKR